jgi:broad specificity phosphatase PhoE
VGEVRAEGASGPHRTLVLLRHGRTAWNHARRVQGQLDVGLDDVGREQALVAAEALAKLGPTLLWSSDLVRARTTAEALAEATGLAPTFDPRLREFHLGERQGFTHEEYAAADPVEFERFRRGHYDSAPGAEPADDVRRRMSAALGELLAALAPGETAVAVSHGAAIRVATGALLGWPDEQFHTLRGLANCGWVVLEEHPEVGALRLAAYNRTG